MAGELPIYHPHAWIEEKFARRLQPPEAVAKIRECSKRFFALATWIHDNIGPDAFEAIEALDRAMIEARTMIEREYPLAETLIPVEPER